MTYATEEKEQEWRRENYLKHRDKIIKRAKKWNKENRDRMNRNRRLWAKRNKDKIRSYNIRQKEKRLQIKKIT